MAESRARHLLAELVAVLPVQVPVQVLVQVLVLELGQLEPEPEPVQVLVLELEPVRLAQLAEVQVPVQVLVLEQRLEPVPFGRDLVELFAVVQSPVLELELEPEQEQEQELAQLAEVLVLGPEQLQALADRLAQFLILVR